MATNVYYRVLLVLICGFITQTTQQRTVTKGTVRRYYDEQIGTNTYEQRRRDEGYVTRNRQQPPREKGEQRHYYGEQTRRSENSRYAEQRRRLEERNRRQPSREKGEQRHYYGEQTRRSAEYNEQRRRPEDRYAEQRRRPEETVYNPGNRRISSYYWDGRQWQPRYTYDGTQNSRGNVRWPTNDSQRRSTTRFTDNQSRRQNVNQRSNNNPTSTSTRSTSYTYWYTNPTNRGSGYYAERRERTSSRYAECANAPTNVRQYINDIPCAQAIDSFGKHHCYNYEQRSLECCEKCLTVKDRRQAADCQYGDRSTDCVNLQPYQCYNTFNQRLCCDSCPNFRSRSQISGCEYGDKAEWCRTMRPTDCYLNGHVCCETCPRYKKADPGCEYGDRMICDALRDAPSSCYRPDIQQNCCESCKRFHTGRPGCEYGDRVDFINTPYGRLKCPQYVRTYGANVCDTITMKEECCATCASY